jgi:hypothetical protein
MPVSPVEPAQSAMTLALKKHGDLKAARKFGGFKQMRFRRGAPKYG